MFDTCEHCRPRYQECDAFTGHLVCPDCTTTFKLDLGKQRAEPFCCPTCGAHGSDGVVEDISTGRSEFCLRLVMFGV